MQAYLAELIGTALLIIFGNGVVANVVLNKTKGNNSGWIVITAGWAFGVTVAAYVTGWVSGAHLNPAVTLGLAASGLFPWAKVCGYIIAQILGAIIGACIVYISYKQHYDETTDPDAIRATFCTGPAIRNLWYNSITELVGTFVLVFGIRGITHANVFKVTLEAGGQNITGSIGILGTLLVGFLVWGIGLSLGGQTGYAINPARDLGPRIAHAFLPIKNKSHSDWGYALVPIIAPIIGGVLGSLLFDILIK